MRNPLNQIQRFPMITAVVLVTSITWVASLAVAADQKMFPTPDAAVAALVAAVRAHSMPQVVAILGPELEAYDETRDKTQDAVDRELFLAASRTLKLEKQLDNPNTIIVYLGESEWPFPAPLVKTPAGWKFDGKAAIEEIQDRQIGRNELDTIELCKAYVDVQLDYFSSDRTGDGYLEFAQKINSTPGKFDGLYWSNANGEDVSPLGPYAAQAAGAEPIENRAPLSGYLFKILTSQGPDAPGGEHSYLLNGRMMWGFALVAWPAEYGVTGKATFIVSQLGIVYQKDLGADTAQIALAMKQFNPDRSWKPAE